MTYKRNAGNGEAPPSKRQLQTTSVKPGEFAGQPKLDDQYVYIVTEELYRPHSKMEQTLSEAYSTLEDANRRVHQRQKELDPADWDDKYDTFGCCQSKSEDGEGEGWNILVRRYLLRPPGSIPSSASSEEESPEPKTPLADIVTSGEKIKHGPRRCGDPDCGDLACVD